MPTKRPSPKSATEETFALQLRAHRIPHVREVRFHPDRQWRLDFLVMGTKIAVELHGGTYSGGRHTRGTGMAGDMEKMNEAARLGYEVFTFDTPMVRKGDAINYLLRVLRERGSPYVVTG